MKEVCTWFIKNIAASVLSAIVGAIITSIVHNRWYWKTWIKTLLSRNNEYRVSFAYLFRIKIDDKYLLTQSKRINQYQPVGGVYKYFDSFEDKYNDWEITHEKNKDFFEDGDLRIYIKGKYLNDFIKWIDTNRNRECDCRREFIEELVQPGYVSLIDLSSVNFEFIKRVNTGIHYSKQFKCKEVLIFDIYEVNCFSKDSLAKLQIAAKNYDDLILASVDDIERQCIQVNGASRKIGEHTLFIK